MTSVFIRTGEDDTGCISQVSAEKQNQWCVHICIYTQYTHTCIHRYTYTYQLIIYKCVFIYIIDLYYVYYISCMYIYMYVYIERERERKRERERSTLRTWIMEAGKCKICRVGHQVGEPGKEELTL